VSMTGRIVRHEGKLCVLYESVNFSEPTMTRMWWVIERTTGNPYTADRPKEGDIAQSQNSGDWRTIDPVTNRSTGSVYIDGKKQAEHVDRVPVPLPKVRKGIETRWYMGRWEKLLKNGWVAA